MKEYYHSQDPRRFYVYGHYSSSGQLFYIGKGTAARYRSKSDRSQRWKDFVEENGLECKIIHDGLTDEEALSLETKLISETPDLINRVKRFKKNTISHDELISNFEYKDGELIRRSNLKKVGTSNQKYSIAEIKGITYPVHRLIYFYFNPSFDWSKQIDHIDGNSMNNKIENLREVLPWENNRNRVLRSETGYQLVHKCFTKGKFTGYQLMFNLNNKRVNLRFLLSSYGSEENCLKAVLEYKDSIRSVLLLIGYTERIYDTRTT